MNKYYIFIIILMSCNSYYSPIDNLYAKLETELDSLELIEFKNLIPENVLKYRSNKFNKIIHSRYKEIDNNDPIYLKDSRRKGIPEIDNFQLFVVIFHLRLNESKIDSNSITSYFMAINKLLKLESEKRSNESKIKRIEYVRGNWNKFKIGDNLKFELPLELKNNQKILTFGNAGNQEDENPIFESSTTIKGKLLNKFVWTLNGDSTEIIDSMNSIFEIRIDSIGANVYKKQFWGDHPTKCVRGDIFKLHLSLYGNRLMN